MADRMIIKIADFIVSPLAVGTHANYQRIKAGESALQRREHFLGMTKPVMVSAFDDDRLESICLDYGIRKSDGTRFERMAILSVAGAVRGKDIPLDGDRTLFVFATTKGNVALLDEQFATLPNREDHILLVETARTVSRYFGNSCEPLVVSNACISGLSAQIEAVRALDSGAYDYVVVIGVDELSPFIVSGFQALNAMSADECRPFDEDRIGLNLGEAAACIIYTRLENYSTPDAWQIVRGASYNDAYHTSSPSKTAEGACRSLTETLRGERLDDIAFINVHGTATLFNDEMEAVAIHRAALSHLPANGLKGFLGHTLGASGVVETLISMEALDDDTVLATRGYHNRGVSRPVNLSAEHRAASGHSFIKMMSGFGGCNAAILFRRGSVGTQSLESKHSAKVLHTVHLTEHSLTVDGVDQEIEGCGMQLLKWLYHNRIGDYPKYHKMDPMSKLGFLASELLIAAEGALRFVERSDRAIVIVGRSSSICADQAYQQTIASADNYFPSPAAFIYTLPNIVTGEIAIRNNYRGETLYLAQDSPQNTLPLMAQLLHEPGITSVLGGWIEMPQSGNFEAICYLLA